MVEMTRFVFVGTSHVSPGSVEAVEKAIKKEKPDMVAVELDPVRYGLMTRPPQKPGAFTLMRSNGPVNFLLMGMLSGLQAALGSRAGVSAGAEMLKAVEAARSRGIRVALIDMGAADIARMIGKIGLLERLKLIALLSGGIDGSLRGRAVNAPSERAVSEALRMLRKKFPRLYAALVVEREAFMAKFLISLEGKCKKAVVVVGAGHVAGLKKRIGVCGGRRA